ncbi:MAG: 50S ribosomal protein L16 [Victivallales bacterium]|nr:50S ribosomal protein L16 [Victivallales bacterium]MCF7889192.1 50S ribosomal protein L16 [Victivallales bacterium]
MPLMPKRSKYRKKQRGSMAGIAQSNNKVDFGDFGLQSMGRGLINGNQIEAARIAINRHLHRKGKVWIRFFPDVPVTKKPLEVRMGKGKGNVDHWSAKVLPGRVLFEVSGCSENMAREALCRAAAKLSVKTKFITR